MTTAIVEQFSKTDHQKAEVLLSRVEKLLAESAQAAEAAQRKFADIASELYEVKKSKAWMLRAHSWEQYLQDCQKKFNLGRTTLFGVVSVAERLLPSMSKDQIIELGMSKSQSLAQYVKRSGKNVPDDLLEKAKTIGVKELRATVAERLYDKPEHSTWFEIGFFCTAAERQEIERAMRVAELVSPLPTDAPKEKIYIQRWVQEFLSEYGHLQEVSESRS